MRILGIDQSFTSSGIIVYDSRTDHILNANRFVSKSNTSTHTRIFNIVQYYKSIYNSYTPHLLVFEGLSFSNFGNATRNLAGLLAVCINHFAFEIEIPVIIIPPRTMKLEFAKNGKAAKIDILNNIPDHHRSILTDEFKLMKSKGLYDVADAYGLTMTALACLKQPKLLSKTEHHNIDNITLP